MRWYVWGSLHNQHHAYGVRSLQLRIWFAWLCGIAAGSRVAITELMCHSDGWDFILCCFRTSLHQYSTLRDIAHVREKKSWLQVQDMAKNAAS